MHLRANYTLHSRQNSETFDIARISTINRRKVINSHKQSVCLSTLCIYSLPPKQSHSMLLFIVYMDTLLHFRFLRRGL
jgi:hypothetical protein